MSRQYALMSFQLVAGRQAQVGLYWHFHDASKTGSAGIPRWHRGNCCSSWKRWPLQKSVEKTSTIDFFSPCFCFFNSYSIIQSVISIFFFRAATRFHLGKYCSKSSISLNIYGVVLISQFNVSIKKC